MNLKTNYLGLDLKNPLLAASSGITDNIDSIKKLYDNGIGAIVLRSLFEEEILLDMELTAKKMASSGFIYPETLDFYENDETHEEASVKYLNLIADAKKAVQVPIIASINCVTADQWVYFPKRIQEAGADALELNLFVIPTDLTRSAADNEKIYFDIIQQVKKQINIPISLKISYYFSNLANMMQRFEAEGVKGLVLFNKYFMPDIDIQSMEVTPGQILSRPEDISMSLRWIAIMSPKLKIDLAASTGVHTSEALIKQLLAGAKVVQIASSLYKNGADYPASLLSGLTDWMQSKGYNSLDEFRGKMSQSNIANPASYERVQFIKHFRSFGKNK